MLFRRYRRAVFQAPVVGFVVAAALFVFILLTSRIRLPSFFSLSETFRSLLIWGLTGAALATAALLGGFVAVALADLRLQRASIVRVTWAAVGAGIGVFAECIIFGAVVSDSGWPLGYTVIGIFGGVIGAITAAIMVNRAERRAVQMPVDEEAVSTA